MSTTQDAGPGRQVPSCKDRSPRLSQPWNWPQSPSLRMARSKNMVRKHRADSQGMWPSVSLTSGASARHEEPGSEGVGFLADIGAPISVQVQAQGAYLGTTFRRTGTVRRSASDSVTPLERSLVSGSQSLLETRDRQQLRDVRPSDDKHGWQLYARARVLFGWKGRAVST